MKKGTHELIVYIICMKQFLQIPILKKLLLLCLMLIASTKSFSQDVILENIKNAQACFARVDAANNYKDNLNQADMNSLPMGIKQTVNNMDITIAVNSAEFFLEYTKLSAFVRIVIPNKKTLFFAADNIKLSHDGDIIGDARLNLLGDIEIPISGNNLLLRLKGSYDNQTGQSGNLTYVEIDCKGFKELGLSAEVELSPDLCSPVDDEGRVIEDKKVTGQFQTRIENWDDIVAKISLPSFSIKGMNGFIWNLKDALVDFSDLKNSDGFTFPDGYQQYLVPGNEALWKGVFVKQLSVTLPPEFTTKDKKRISYAATDMLIDDNGITGTFSADNVLNINQGNAGGWAFSVDHFALRMMANTLEEAKFKGQVGLPISQNSTLLYDGTITADNKYILKVQPTDKISFDLLQAKAEIDPNSYVEFKVKNGQFKPEAMLHGRMGIDVVKNPGSSSAGQKTIAQFKGIEFRSLHLQTEAPYLSVEYLGYQEDVRLLNFPVSVKNIALKTTDNSATLGFDLDVTLMDGTFKGNTRLEIVGAMDQGELQKWKFSKVNLDKVNLDATIAEAFNVKGGLDIMNSDPVYGDGLSGNLSLEFREKSPLKGLKVNMRGMFGCTDFHYWFLDGIAKLPGNGIPVAPGLNLTGFGGGVSYRMKPEGLSGAANGAVLSATSMSYVPDKGYSLGIKAATAFNIPQNNVAQGEACFELAFNNKGGLNYAGFYGFTKFAGKIPGADNIQSSIGDKYKEIVNKEKKYIGDNKALADALEKSKQYNPNEAGKLYTDKDKIGNAGFTAAAGIQYNFAESSFHATFDLYVNVLGGVIQGVASGHRAGYAVIHIDPKDWYIHMGTPTDRIGLQMGIGKLLNIKTGSYLMVGTQIPAAPSVPSPVASLLNETPDNLNYMKDMNSLNAGKGFAFGSSLEVNTGDLTFLILYANYSAGLGFDIMLKDYGEAQCQGRSGAVGINGWYANGQAYAYMHGELGVKVNLWFIKAKVPVINADFATLMQAKLPNPSSFKAYIAVKARVLGLVSVDCRFKVLVGEDCDLVIPGGSPLDMQMISSVSPADKADDINVFTAPQAAFNMPIGKPFNVQDDEGEKTFRLQLKDFALNDGQNINGELKWNTDKSAVSFYSHEVLPSQKNITATVKIAFEQYKNNRWSQVYTSGKEAIETKAISFKTNDAPKDIPLQNIVYAYPVVDQKYFLKDESKTGYIQLQYGQSYLFPAGLANKIEIKDASGHRQLADFRYDESKKRIEYTLPQTQNQTAYSLSILSMSNATSGKADIQNNQAALLNDNTLGNISVDNKQATAETRTDIGQVLLTYNFSAGRYSTFRQKIESIKKGNAAVNKLSSDLLMFEYETIDMEPFDLAELTGTSQTDNKPLVSVLAELDDRYYKEKIYPLIYSDYPVQGTFRIKARSEEEYGVPPVKALPVMGTYLSQIENNLFTGLVQQRFPYYYNLPQIYKTDFSDLRMQIVNAYLGTNNPAYVKFLTGTFPFISPGYYKIRLQYVMPGGVKGTSAGFEYYNFLGNKN
jgi:hypothetical protein